MPRKQLRPPIKLRKRYAALILACRDKILTAPPQTSGTEGGRETHISILIAWPVKEGVSGKTVPDYPKGFPAGVVVRVEEGKAIVKHSCVKLLQHFKDSGYITYTAATLFAARLPILMRIAKMELGLERSVDLLQHVEQELLADNEDSVYNDRTE